MKQRTHTQPNLIDPYAAGYLQQRLGDEKWTIFSTRFSERRLAKTNNKLKMKLKPGCADVPQDGDKQDYASAIDFLVKVEIVKEVLRVYVPCVSLRSFPPSFKI